MSHTLDIFFPTIETINIRYDRIDDTLFDEMKAVHVSGVVRAEHQLIHEKMRLFSKFHPDIKDLGLVRVGSSLSVRPAFNTTSSLDTFDAFFAKVRERFIDEEEFKDCLIPRLRHGSKVVALRLAFDLDYVDLMAWIIENTNSNVFVEGAFIFFESAEEATLFQLWNQ